MRNIKNRFTYGLEYLLGFLGGRKRFHAFSLIGHTMNINALRSYKVFESSAISALGFMSYNLIGVGTSCDGLEKVELGKASNFEDGEMYEVKVHGGKDTVLVSKVKGKYYCTGYTCPHFSAPFKKGASTDTLLICPYHNAKFKLADGECINGPCFKGIPTYKVSEENGTIYASLPPYPLPEHVDMPKKKADKRDSRVFVICGGGAAGYMAAETLRLQGFTGSIVIYGKEKHLPYYRPHLTKKYESKSYDEVAADQALNTNEFYMDNDIKYYGGRTVKSINHENNTVILDDNSTVKYDKVLVAIGSEAAKLPLTEGSNLSNHFTVRTTDDLKNLSKFIKPDANIVIIGANFIGCELASALKPTGAKITVLTEISVPMEKIVGKRVGYAISKLFEKNQINFIPNATIKSYITREDKITGVVLNNGEIVKADCVIEGVGTKTNTDILKCAKLGKNGTIVVDSTFRCVGCPDNVFAAGDIVSYPYHLTDNEISVMHWNVALQHGRVAAKNMLDVPAKMDMVPFFWSNFFQKSIRFAGVADDADEVIHEGDVENHRFVAYYFRKKNAVAVMAMNMDDVGAIMAEALDKGCVPSHAALKLGAANSQSMVQCMKELKVK